MIRNSTGTVCFDTGQPGDRCVPMLTNSGKWTTAEEVWRLSIGLLQLGFRRRGKEAEEECTGHMMGGKAGGTYTDGTLSYIQPSPFTAAKLA